MTLLFMIVPVCIKLCGLVLVLKNYLSYHRLYAFINVCTHEFYAKHF